MGWQDRIRTGTFRGEEFVLIETSRAGGRRLAKQHPLRTDTPSFDDLGRQGPVWRLRFFVLGADHDLAAQAMIRALEDPRPGFLRHPLHGTHRVRVESDALHESVDELGVTTFEAEFHQVVDGLPNVAASSTAEAASAAAAAQEAAGEAVTDGLEVHGVPEFVRAATASAVAAVGTVLRGLRFIAGTAEDVARVAALASNLVASAARLALAPVDLVLAVRSAARQVGNATANARESFYAYRQLFDLEPGRAGGSTAQAQAADRNQVLVTDLLLAEAAAAAAQAAVRAEWQSGREAGQARDELFALLAALEERAGDDLVQALQDLRAMLHRTAFASELPDDDRTHVTLAVTSPAILVAYRYLDDAEREAEVVALNEIAHPLFVPGGVELEVPLAE